MKRVILVICAIALSFVATYAEVEVSASKADPTDKADPTNAKGIAISASVDLGPNTRELLEQGVSTITKLAISLGMNAKTIFPYYVKQSRLKGLTNILVCGGFVVTCLLLAIVLFLLGMYYEAKGKKGFIDVFCTFAAIMFVLFIFGFALGIISLSDWIALAKNPEYAAIQSIMKNANDIVSTLK